MTISEDEQWGYDFDWFAVDEDGYLVHLTSNGGLLPASVAASRAKLKMLERYFSTLPELVTNEAIEAGFTDTTPAGDLSSYLKYIRRGLFSFDRTAFNHHNSCVYHLVARPPKPLLITDLPADLAALATRTQLPFSVVKLVGFNTMKVL